MTLKKKRTKSKAAFKGAQKVLVGGVNSPVRAFQAVGGQPLFFQKGQGPYLYDLDGNKYIDFCLSWGALILGHADAQVVRAISRQAKWGTSFGAPTIPETDIAARLTKLFPSCEQFRFTSSGTEAVMSAIRLARGFTGKPRIIKFEGCYHGHSDCLLVKAGSGLATLGHPSSDGVPEEMVEYTTLLPYNDEASLDAAFKRFSDIGCVVLEPMAGNMGFIPATASFIQKVRQLADRHKALVVFDEVITGLRVALGGAQRIYGVKADITTLGKVIGGGMPVGAFGARREIMQCLAPLGSVYQAGTLSGNCLSMAAGIAAIDQVSKKGVFLKMENRAKRWAADLQQVFDKKGIAASVHHCGSVFGVFFQKNQPLQFSDITRWHVDVYRRFFNHMLENGIYLPPSAYEAMFISTAHKEIDFHNALIAAEDFRG